MKRLNYFVWALVVLLCVSAATSYGVVYVNQSASGFVQDGTSWKHAYKYLRDALGTNREIWIAAGTYYPDQTKTVPGGTGLRTDTFTLYYGCKIYGGFDGTETSLSQRNCHANRTILCGDLSENDAANFVNYEDNSYHVISGGWGDDTCLLDGLTIQAGAATAAGAAEWGGGIFNTQAVVQNCVIRLNMALYGGGYSGLGTLINCIINDNDAASGGGGVYLNNGVITNCVFFGNEAIDGAGAYCWGDRSQNTITNCTFTDNYASGNRGDALFITTYFSQSGSYSEVSNCIFWTDGAVSDCIFINAGSESSATLDIDYCVIEGGQASIDEGSGGATEYGAHNITSNPLLVNRYRLAASSPALDAGDNSRVPLDSTDVDGDGNTTEELPLDADGKIRFVDDPAADTGNGTAPLADIGACERNGIIYVDADAAGDNNGASWYDAYLYLQDALSAASSGDEIWVAQGDYLTDRNTANPGGTGLRSAAFYLINGVGIYGGFAGKELMRGERNYLNYKSVLSGDIGSAGSIVDNSYHVINTLSNNATAVLDGFTITAGYANGASTSAYGGGMYVNGQPVILHCTFIRNAGTYGGGVFITSNSPAFTNCAFLGNSGGYGGGMFIDHAKSTLVNCLFSGNSAVVNGGGIYSNNDSITTLINCTLNRNSASASGYAGGINVYESEVIVDNCILWGNTALNGPQIALASGTLTVDYCDIQGGSKDVYAEGSSSQSWGVAIDSNPMFADADGPDDTVGNEDDNLRLLIGSPCINTGANKFVPAGITTDLDEKNRFVGTVDMGAYERQLAPLIIYVDDSAPGSNTGTSWFHAYRYLQDALSVAQSTNQVWVASGTYKPDRGTANPSGTGSRDATFLLENGVSLYGGFAGNETSLSGRDWRLYVSILSGDLAGDDGANFTNYTENSRHVVTGSGCDGTAVIDGFTIISGNGDAVYPANSGGGLYNYFGSPTVNNCVFLKNLAAARGAAIFTQEGAPNISNCSFLGNKAVSGAALNNAYNASPVITNSIFSGNIATEYGGAIQNAYSSNITLKNCTFSGNSAGIWGGAVRAYNSSPTIINCIFWGNTATQGAQLDADGGGTMTVSYCDVQGGQTAVYVSGSTLNWSAGNVDIDPLFVDADGADNMAGTTDDDLHLRAITSIANAGDPAGSYAGQVDMDGAGRELYGRVDIGADEVYPIPGDFEPNGIVDLSDLWYFAARWLNSPCVAPDWCGKADMNQSGTVNLSDFVYLGKYWLW